MSRLAFITGGASGIGLAIAQGLLAEGWRVVVTDINDENLANAEATLDAHAGRVRFEKCDIADEAAIVAAVDACEQQLGGIEALVNSAGIGREIPALETSAELFRKVLDVNLVGSFLSTREVARRMRARKHGAIVNIASVSGLRANRGRMAYGASKAGVILMTQVLAVELAPYGIRVNAVAPGPIETPLVQQMHSPASRSEWVSRIPQRRYGTPEELVGAVMFLLDPQKSSFVTGQVLAVDGGFMAGGLLGEDPTMEKTRSLPTTRFS